LQNKTNANCHTQYLPVFHWNKKYDVPDVFPFLAEESTAYPTCYFLSTTLFQTSSSKPSDCPRKHTQLSMKPTASAPRPPPKKSRLKTREGKTLLSHQNFLTAP
jgi:hypothetical protein